MSKVLSYLFSGVIDMNFLMTKRVRKQLGGDYSKLLLVLIIEIFALVGCASVKSKYADATSVNTVKSYEAFIAENPESSLVADARRNIENIYWQDAQRVNTIESYQSFLNKYPKTSHPAADLIETLFWEEAMKSPSVSAMEKYIAHYPGGEHAVEATRWLQVESAWVEVTAHPTLEALEAFEKNQGENRYSQEAEKKIEDLKRDKRLHQIQASLVSVHLIISSAPITRGGSISFSSNPWRDGFTNGKMQLKSIDEGQSTPPKKGNVYVIGKLSFDAKTMFKLKPGENLYLQSSNGKRYIPYMKVPMFGWTKAATITIYPNQVNEPTEVFFELPRPNAKDAKLNFFGKYFSLNHNE